MEVADAQDYDRRADKPWTRLTAADKVSRGPRRWVVGPHASACPEGLPSLLPGACIENKEARAAVSVAECSVPAGQAGRATAPAPVPTGSRESAEKPLN